MRSNFYKGQEKCHQVLLNTWKQKNISIFALYPCGDIFILPQVSEKTQHCKMNSCNITNLLCKMGSFVVVLQVRCKILVVVLQLAKKTFMFLLSGPFFSLFFPVCSLYSSQELPVLFFPTVCYKHQNETFLKMQWGHLLLNCIKYFN